MSKSLEQKCAENDLGHIIVSLPLYEKIPIKDNYHLANQITHFGGTVDAFCIACAQTSVFRSTKLEDNLSTKNEANCHVAIIRFTCSRNPSHEMFVMWRIWANEIEKIGQFPSLADLAAPDQKNYRKSLGEENFAEYRRGIGLFAHGIGIGAFVYLRRVLERLVNDAAVKTQQSADWNKATYEASRVAERIKMVAPFLPGFLVDNRELYGILSKGVHELSEQECLDAFPTIRLGIELILDQEIERRSASEKIKSAQDSIAQLAQRLKNPSLK